MINHVSPNFGNSQDDIATGGSVLSMKGSEPTEALNGE